jgi:hypothetical protein
MLVHKHVVSWQFPFFFLLTLWMIATQTQMTKNLELPYYEDKGDNGTDHLVCFVNNYVKEWNSRQKAAPSPSLNHQVWKF